MEFLGYCLAIGFIGWIIYFFVAMFCNTINSCVSIKKDIDKIKKNNKKK